jgi:ABC-type multidrug transport system fused ATPase/permease subunit
MWEKRVQNRHLVSYVFQAFTALLRDGFAYGYLVFATIDGRIGISDAILYFGAISRFSEWVTQIVTQFNAISQAQLLLCDMRAYLERQDMRDPDPAVPLPDLSSPPEIVFDDVCFAYGKGGKNVIDHFSLRIASGESVALVGVNGAGKTTVVKLLCGFYKPDSGHITIGGTDVSGLSKSDLAALFSAVFQDAFVLPMTLAENIALREDKDTDRLRIEKCVELAGLYELVSRTNKGIDAEMMKISDENGLMLSGGETQKLLLARALYKDALILILDEPTAALDPIAESRMYERYGGFTEGKTSIFISHRLASTRFCDRVVFLQDGHAAEIGTHDELIAGNGKYAEMFEIQSHYYREEAAV